ncbi:deleted in malignant brain tumors 1 protein-like [Amphiprion ocellaris]|uniref:CUB and zona pellucida-like domains 1, tandem duplicate 1 n=1 Tax=Amphiprion ocellaris TaxID=80972 RepID=A0A3Q1B8T0_AMPOC|nr:deleted in malignant brain tumors 1 protein-like [Amphiprion ocellaris]
MWTLLFLCSVLTTHGVQVAGWYYTAFATEPVETTVAETEDSETTLQVTDEPCGGSLYGNNGAFSSPNYPNNYPNNKVCLWYIRTDGNIVQLNFTHVNIESAPNCVYDAISVYDGPSTGSRLLGKICGTQRPTFYSTTASLTVQFKTDSIITRSGFEASYKVINSVQRSCRDNCGNHMGSCSCFDSCRDNGDCCHDYSWYCSHYSTNRPETTFPTSTPEPTFLETTGQPSCRYNCGRHMGSCSCRYSCYHNGNCCHDYGPYCSYYSTEAPATVQPSCRYNCGRHMGSCSCSSSCRYYGNCCRDYSRYCYYTTFAPATAQPSCRYNCGRHMGSCSCSSSCQYYGNCCYDYYSYCYTTTHWPHITQWYTTGSPCGGYLFGSGTFSSPNHPDHYDDNSYCVWQLRAAHDQRIYLTFDFVELENCCGCDYISVYDGSSEYSGLLGKVCNGNVASFFSTYTYMTVVFRTDISVVARGFRAEFMSTLRSSSGRVECSSDNMNIAISRNYLSSLGYDGNDLYLNDPNCRPYYNSRNEVVFSYSITSCGNVKKIDNGTVVYTNIVGAYNSSSSSSEITRQSHFELNVNCRMEKDSVSQIVYIVSHSGSNSIIGSGRFNTSMDFYTSSSFSYKVTERPYRVSLNEYMYVQVELRRPDSSLVIFLDTCVASPSADDFYSRPYYLVRNGCSADSTYYPYMSGTWYKARFRFKSFQFLRASKAVYIQCTVLICPASDNNSRCRRGCMRRTARDLGSDHDSQTLVLGPIQLKDPEKKEEGSDEQSKA